MNSQLPPSLAPYIQQCIQLRSLTLLTSVLDTPANWLLARFIAAALNPAGQRGLVANQAVSDGESTPYSVVLVSLWRSFDLWAEILKKCGANLQDAVSANRVHYIDGLSTSNAPKKGISNLSTLSLRELCASITDALRNLTAQSPANRTVTVIDGLDFLLAAEPSTTALDVQQMLLDVQTQSHGVVVTCAADSALLHNIEASATPLEMEHAILARSLAHNARWLFQLRPLETGQSREVSGSVRVSHGGAWDNDVEEGVVLSEGEWLYHVKGDGNVRVWGRGEA